MLVGVVAVFDVFVVVCVAAIVVYFVVLGGAVVVAVIVVVDVTLVLAGNLKQLLLLETCPTKITFFFVLQNCFSKSHVEQYIT